MKTGIYSEDVHIPAGILRAGGLVAVPTETVYGLAANGLDGAAVEKIYAVKGRPESKPISLLVPGPEALDRCCVEVPRGARVLAEKFWPGPLTIVLKARPHIPGIVRAGGETIGLRCPDHRLTLELLRQTGLPLAAPSANPSGQPSPKTADQVLAYFDGRIDAVIDGGACGIGRESTVLDMSRRPFRILRQGALAGEEIAAALAGALTVFGVTGGSGAGKTTALELFRERGALVLDCDRVYHELLLTDGALLAQLEEHFPGTVRDGVLDRKALGERVFSDPEALALLNGITHRHVCREVERRLAAWAMEGGELAAVDAVGLPGSELEKRCTATVFVTASPETRLRRIMERDGIGREQALLRLRAQQPDSWFQARCSYTVVNDSGKEPFAAEIKNIIQEVVGNG